MKSIRLTKRACFEYAPMILAFFAILIFAIIFQEKFINVLPLFISLVVYFLKSKAHPFAFLLDALNSMIFVVIYYQQGLYGSVISISIGIVLAVLAFVRWKKNAYKQSTIFKKMHTAGRIILAVVLLAAWGVSCYALNKMNGSQVALDGLVLVLGFLIPLLNVFAYVDVIPLNLLNQFIACVIWICVVIKGDMAKLTYVASTIYSVSMSIVQSIVWIKLYKEQQKMKSLIKEENMIGIIMKKVKFGIIGLGNQGNNYADLFKNGVIENGELVAVCDIRQDRIDHLLSKFESGALVAFQDYKEMLDSGVCDAILVETPHYQHPEIVMECLKREIHVICDKPAGVYTKQVREMNEEAVKHKALFGMMFNQRTNCVYRKMKEIIQQGGIGQLQRVTWIITNWYRTQCYYDNGSWRATWAGEGGGVLINQCPHQLDLVQWVVGEMPKTVRGFCHYGKWHDIEVEDEVTAYFEYENGATGVFITTTGETPGTNRFEVSGTGGKLLCEGDKLYWFKTAEDGQVYSKTSNEPFIPPLCEKIEVETDGKNPRHAGIINNFANALLGLEPLFVSGVDGFNGVELMNAIELSGWRNGEAVSLPVNEDEYLAELNARRATSRLKEEVCGSIANMEGTFGSEAK